MELSNSSQDSDSHTQVESQQVPSHYFQLPLDEILDRATEAKKVLGDDLLILAHHYQNDATFQLCDVSGDSLYLARQAAQTPAKYIVFCGVHFMAESSDVITAENQITILPELSAGCSMADMASMTDVKNCWEVLTHACGPESFIPITYINSTADLKAFCAQHGGTVCTSSNSDKILTWALGQGKRVVFFPDQHLGRNTANALGVPSERIMLWNRFHPRGGLDDDMIRNSQVMLWNGYCEVHCHFQPSEIEELRHHTPGIKIIVHPECPEAIVQMADDSGSTDKIIRLVTESNPDVQWAIGTEANLVNRLATRLAKEQNKLLYHINPSTCVCKTMNQTHPAHILWILENLIQGRVINQITVPDGTKQLAKLALDRMLTLS